MLRLLRGVGPCVPTVHRLLAPPQVRFFTESPSQLAQPQSISNPPRSQLLSIQGSCCDVESLLSALRSPSSGAGATTAASLWAVTARMDALLSDYSRGDLRRLLRYLSFRDAADSGGDGDKGGSGSGGRSNSKDGKSGGDPAASPDDETLEDRIVPLTVLFVLLMFVLTYLLWRASMPAGRHVGWSSLTRHAGEIQSVELYEHYAQVHTDSEKVYLGLISDQDTQHRIDDLASVYKMRRAEETAATAMADAEGAPTGRASDDATAHGAERPEELVVHMRGRPASESALAAVGVFAWVVPFVFFPVFVMLLTRYIGNSMSIAVASTQTKTKVKEMIFKVETASNTRFRDIAGMKEPKREITEIVDFLKHPDRYTRLGAKIPTGALLLGPPGTGKTLLAKAVAGESGVGFIPVCGSDFVELYVGMGALRVRELFKVAKKQRCIVYIDEIDAIGLKRQGAGHGEKQEQEQTLNELLTQLDGFKTGRRGDIMVLASTNVAQDALDPALIRPGRFDRIIHVDSPVISERVDIFKVHLSKIKLVPDVEGKVTAAASTTMPATEDENKGEASSAGKDSVERGADGADATGAKSTPNSNAATAAPTSEPASTETRIVISALEAEKEKDAALQAKDGQDSFDFRALLMSKSDMERALIEAYAARMSDLCPGFVGADIANVCNEAAILAAREGAVAVDITHLERSIDRVLAGIEQRSRVLSPFEKNVVAHHEAGHAVAGWFLNRADPLMKVSIVPRGGSALGYAQYLPNENFTRTAKEIRDSMSVTLGGRAAEQIFFSHLSTGASDDLRKVAQMAYLHVSSFSAGSVYPAPGSSSTRLVKPFGANRSNAMDAAAKLLVDEVYKETVELLTKHKADMEKLAQHLLTNEMLTYQDVVNYLGKRGDRMLDKRKGV